MVFCAIFLGVFCTPVPDGSLNTPLSGLAMELSASSCLIVVVGDLSIYSNLKAQFHIVENVECVGVTSLYIVNIVCQSSEFFSILYKSKPSFLIFGEIITCRQEEAVRKGGSGLG